MYERRIGLRFTAIAAALILMISALPLRGAAQAVSPLPTFPPAEIETYRDLTVGDQGDDVLALKERLTQLGYMRPDTAFTSAYSDATADAVAQFQKAWGLEETGIADAYTQALLFSQWAETAPEETPSPPAYIGNRNTKKFHKPSCSSVDQMKDSNKAPLSSREEAIRNGYVPCKRCNP